MSDLEEGGPHKQGVEIPVSLHDGTVVKHELHSIHYKLLPTGIAVCTYNTPKTLNCLSTNQMWEMFLLLDFMQNDPMTKVVIWTGAGRAFNSGADLKNDSRVFLPPAIQAHLTRKGLFPSPEDWVLSKLTRAFWDFPKPSICAINGITVGGACNIALANYHDIVVCSDVVKFMYPFAKLGFSPELASSFVLPFVVGFAKAKELVMLGEWMSASEALRLGLVNYVVSPQDLMDKAMEIAEKLVVIHPQALTSAKKIINGHYRKQLDQILADEQREFNIALNTTGGPLKSAMYMREQAKLLKAHKSKL